MTTIEDILRRCTGVEDTTVETCDWRMVLYGWLTLFEHS